MDEHPSPGTPVQAGAGASKKPNGSAMFCAVDPQGYTISLDVHRWDTHILVRHPEMNRYADLLRETVEQPNVIQQQSDGASGTYLYYRLSGRSFYASTDVYILLAVGRDEATKSGFVKTAYIVKKIGEGKVIWARKS